MSDSLPDDLSVRILQFLDGDLMDEEVHRLDGELLASREARACFLQLAALHSALECQGQSRAENANVPVIPIERLLARQRRRVVRITLLATAAVLILSALGLWLKLSSPPSATLARFRVAADSKFTLTHGSMTDVPAGNALGEGSRLQLSRGTMEGTFASGVRFVIEGPCDLTVVADDRIALAEGNAWFEVTPQAVGFTVETGQLEAVDLGTRFGMIAPAEGPHEVHVTQGSVEAASKLTPGLKRRIKGGEALRLHPELGLQPIPIQPERFTKTLPELITLTNPSFEDDENTDPDGLFNKGFRSDFGGELTGWTAKSGNELEVHIGWRDIDPTSLHPDPPEPGRESQALSLISGASVQNLTGTPWSSLRAGDKLTLTLSLGMRAGLPALNWNEKTFFGLTDARADLSTIEPADTVAHSGMIANNPATGSQSGNGTFKDVSISYHVKSADLARPGTIGILIHSAGSGGGAKDINQAFFDNVRLLLTKGAPSETADR
jgi:hypothetical protein